MHSNKALHAGVNKDLWKNVLPLSSNLYLMKGIGMLTFLKSVGIG